ncbi:sensor histidine kinase [Lentzea flaviverrucosa]|uniref:Two-component system, NarL family, sensor histidine kinase DesK n=1 Tax=Lentzea flaviverrucosa TaxID=200379 RepID=A0A1H9FVJ5_9PSEU|nr:histidine kinase [Lentzea flaviverrucosa]RDI35089.1 two-component system sensor histidine kinase DesK [Lentzea flaviverrucosa]SEQ41950.1 two-component system, NarL family, sensor histidine kinase DesK [Lentzea flaviverrucosa]
MNDLPHVALRGTLHVLWLSALAVPLISVLREPSALRWLGVLGLLVLAVAYAVTLRGGPLWVLGAATLATIPLVAPVGPDELSTWAWIGGAAAGFAPLLLSGPWRWLAAIGAVVVSGLVGFFVGRDQAAYQMIAAAVGVTIIAMAGLPMWFAGLLGQARAGREAQADLAVSEERLRFARDVHDLLGHRLTVIALKSELAGRLAATDPERSAAEAFEAQRLASSALEEVRDAVHGYRAVNLPEQLEAVRTVLQEAGIRCTVSEVPVEGERATQLALALREACTNVLRHSHATWCMIDVAAADEEVRMTVTNDGAEKPSSEGNGLRGLRERLAAVGGQVSVEKSGDVFTLQVVVPA